MLKNLVMRAVKPPTKIWELRRTGVDQQLERKRRKLRRVRNRALQLWLASLTLPLSCSSLAGRPAQPLGILPANRNAFSACRTTLNFP